MSTPILLILGSLTLIPPPAELAVRAKVWPGGEEIALPFPERYRRLDLSPLPEGPLNNRGVIREGDVARALGVVLVDPAADPPNLIGYTTDDPALDYPISTIELERFDCALFPLDMERTYRKVLILGGSGFTVAQPQRYGCFLEDDPRVTRDRFAAQRREAAEREQREAAALAADLAFLNGLDLPALTAEVERRAEIDGTSWKRAKDIKSRLEAAAASAAKEARYQELAAGLAPGVLVVRPFRPAVRGSHWSAPEIPAMILEVGWMQMEVVDVTTDAGERQTLKLSDVHAMKLTTPDMSAYPVDGEVRRKIHGHLGSLLEATRHEVGGKVYWTAGRYSWEPVKVVDGTTGNLVRKKALVEHLTAAHLDRLPRR
jgi:hypothetical protein